MIQAVVYDVFNIKVVLVLEIEKEEQSIVYVLRTPYLVYKI